MTETPSVTIVCTAFNHSPFIRQCLDGFIMQKTSFPVEVLIHDDASTDDTADIIREYELKYPNIIKPIYQTENQFSKNISIFKTFILPKLNFKYIAICEGDDYWIDEYKLQKQVDFLEKNTDYSICFHEVKTYSEEKKEFINNIIINIPDESDIKTLAKKNYINTPSVMYRNNHKTLEDYNNFPKLLIGDYIRHMLFANTGKIKKLNDIMAIYRLHKDGIWQMKTREFKISNWLKILSVLICYFRDDLEICAILNNQYMNYSIQLFPTVYQNQELELIKKSKSYRITKPLRDFSTLMRNIKNKRRKE